MFSRFESCDLAANGQNTTHTSFKSFIKEAARREGLMEGHATLRVTTQSLVFVAFFSNLYVVHGFVFLSVVVCFRLLFIITFVTWYLMRNPIFVWRYSLLHCAVTCFVYRSLYVLLTVCLILEGLEKMVSLT
jgi:hypothetical protein